MGNITYKGSYRTSTPAKKKDAQIFIFFKCQSIYLIWYMFISVTGTTPNNSNGTELLIHSGNTFKLSSELVKSSISVSALIKCAIKPLCE